MARLPYILLSSLALSTWLCLPLPPFAGANENEAATQGDSKIKNVLFIISDDLRASVLGCYGDAICQTPNIDRLAQQGMQFNRAYCQGTVCAPSRQSLMFSRYLDKRGINLGQHLRERGMYTARVGKIYHMKVPGDIIAGTDGLDVASSWTERFNSPGLEAHTPGDYACLNLNIFSRDFANRQSTAMPHRMFVTVRQDGDGSQQPDFKSASKAIELLREKGDQPFFLAVGLVRPHYPMVAPQHHFDAYPWQNIPLPAKVEGDLDDIPKQGIAGTVSRSNPIGKFPDNQRRMWNGYYAAVSFMDAQVGRIIAELERLGLRDSTAVVFTSDHGYHLGEHGFWQKANLHEQVIRIPLIIDAPGFPSGRSEALVELLDVYPTLCELLGTAIPTDVQGKSVVPTLNVPEQAHRSSVISFNKGISLRTADWHFMRYKDGSKELYHNRADPNEFVNLISDQQYRDIASKLERELDVRTQEFADQMK